MDTKHVGALDDLFRQVEEYRDGPRLLQLFYFIRRFPKYAPFNAFLLHIQKPGSQYVGSVEEWSQLNRRVIPGARPLVILWPFSPVRFVYELTETEGEEPLPPEILNPFRNQGELPKDSFRNLSANLPCYGVSYNEADHGSGSAGFLQPASRGRVFMVGNHKVAIRYDIIVNRNHTPETRFATIAHELGHLFCGHLGNPGHGLWPSRTGFSKEEKEFEAESVTWLVCERAGITNPSAEYLAGYLDSHGKAPAISFEAVFKAVNMVEEMAREPMRPKKRILEKD